MKNRIKQLRQERGLSQSQFVKCLSVSKQSISNWENGKVYPPIKMVIKIANFFSVSTDYLLEFDKDYLQITGISNSQIAHIQQLINYMKNI